MRDKVLSFIITAVWETFWFTAYLLWELKFFISLAILILIMRGV